mmetsp:Transcript_59621/g.118142  ORF Transcript_59621/g.118142 Transcript_59621/m.118142 type:complete len:382 (-) Transcript_59621:249-1394(-)
MEHKPCLIPCDPNSCEGGASSVSVTGAFKRAGLAATILAMSSLGLFASWEAPWQSTLEKLHNHTQVDVVSLAAQEKALADGVKSALKQTLSTASGLTDQIQNVKETGDQAEKEISKWAEAEGTKNNEEIAKYVKRMAHASVALINVQTDFKGWCYVQYTLYNINQRRLKKKFANAKKGKPVNIDTEFTLIDKALTRGLKSLKEMMEKVESVQSDFKVLAAQAKNMLREIEEQKKELEHKAAMGHKAVVVAGAGCAAAAVLSIGTAVGTMGAATPLSAGIVAVGCAGVAGAGSMTIAMAADHFAKQFEEQAGKVDSLFDKCNTLGDRAKRDYANMADVKSKMQVLKGLMINDPEYFEDAVMPELKKLVDVLHKLAKKQKIDR